MDINLLRGLVTIAALAAFLGVVWWAYAPSRKSRFERDALLPFGEDDAWCGMHADGGSHVPSPLPPLPSGEGKWAAGNVRPANSRKDGWP